MDTIVNHVVATRIVDIKCQKIQCAVSK